MTTFSGYAQAIIFPSLGNMLTITNETGPIGVLFGNFRGESWVGNSAHPNGPKTVTCHRFSIPFEDACDEFHITEIYVNFAKEHFLELVISLALLEKGVAYKTHKTKMVFSGEYLIEWADDEDTNDS